MVVNLIAVLPGKVSKHILEKGTRLRDYNPKNAQKLFAKKTSRFSNTDGRKFYLVLLFIKYLKLLSLFFIKLILLGLKF